VSEAFYEVDAQLRAARAQALARRAWPYALGVLIALAVAGLAAWGWSSWQAAQNAKAADAYATGVGALTQNDAHAAEAAFGPLTRSAPRAYRAMALMQVAGLRLAKHKDAAAIELLDQAGRVAPGPVLGDAALLKAALVAMDSRPYGDVAARLQPLTRTGRPFRVLAREALGMAKLAAGAPVEAKSDFVAVSLSTEASDTDRARARAAISLIDDGSAKSLPALIRAAAALPPPSNLPLLPIAPAAGAAAQ